MGIFHLTRRHAAGALLVAVMLSVALLGLLPTVTLAQSNGAAHQRAHATGLALSGNYRLLATEIDGQDAHLNLVPDLFYPTLTFSATTIQGLTITHQISSNTSLTLSATTATTTAVAIKTSIFTDLSTALGSFADKGDLLTLIAGGTVKMLKMTNVNLAIDHAMTVANTVQTNFHVAVTSGVVGGAAPTPTSTPTATGTGTPTTPPTLTTTPGPGHTATPAPSVTPTPHPTQPPGPTATPTPQPTPLPTATATATPPPAANWLQVLPTTLNLTCGQSVNVTLQNVGPTGIFWSVGVPFLGGIAVTPTYGWLNSGASVTIKITNTAVFSAHQDTLSFTAYNSQAGQPAKLSYTLTPCL